ncbi:MAG TPA: hypothetical protein VGI17_12625 [Solirubrobacterales bacterium]|jgi:hypothetical protein
MARRILFRHRGHQPSEWSSEKPRIGTRLLKLDIALLAITAVGAFVIYEAEVLPLSAGPTSPPSGVSLAWAGMPLRGYTETNYIAAESCDKPVRVLLDLYRLGVAPPGHDTQGLRPRKVALAIAGDPALKPEDVRIWGSRPGQDVSLRMLYRPGARFPPPLPVRVHIRRNPSTGEQESIAFVFNWRPVTQRHIEVFLESDWLSSRTADRSCWLAVPGELIDGGDAIDAANDAIGHPEWIRAFAGQPLSNAGTWVNKDGGGELLVDPSASIPAPNSIGPASWRCGLIDVESSCKAAAVLEPPSAEATASERLVIWSTLGGILLSICGAAFIALVQRTMSRS